MPIYDYSCHECGRLFEELVRTDTKVSCPACGSARVERTLSLPARPVGASAKPADFSGLGPPPGGGCCGGGCHGHSH